MPEPGPPYTSLSPVYDRWQRSYGMEYNQSILPRLLQTFRRYTMAPTSLLEIGCGTGTMALLLAKEGWKVVGVDTSEGMITQARQKGGGDSTAVQFMAGDIRGLSLEREFHAAVSLYDVFNHLEEVDDLVSTFRAIRSFLLADGLFVFDVNNERGYRRLWRRNDVIRHHDFTMAITNSFDAAARRAVSEVTVTFADGSPGVEERIVQRQFLKKEIREALRAAAFDVVEARDFAFPSAPGAGRLKTWWIARTASQRGR